MVAEVAGPILERSGDNAPKMTDSGHGTLRKWGPFVPCFRCGVCCTKYKVRLDLPEARRFADGLGLNWYTFLDNYIEPLWTGADNFFLRQQNGACIFLKQTNEPHRTICLVHGFKPSACRDWTPSLYRCECQQGLAKLWGLSVDTEGGICGPADRIQSFQFFLESLARDGTSDVGPEVKVVGRYGQSTAFGQR